MWVKVRPQEKGVLARAETSSILRGSLSHTGERGDAGASEGITKRPMVCCKPPPRPSPHAGRECVLSHPRPRSHSGEKGDAGASEGITKRPMVCCKPPPRPFSRYR